MQCPKCGFENIPGRDECLVCSSSMTSKTADESVYPTRAKDRSLWDRISWQFEHRIPETQTQRIADRSNALRSQAAQSARGISSSVTPTFNTWRETLQNIRLNRIRFPRFSLRQWGLVSISVIPGLGHIFALKKNRLGILIILTAIGMLLTAVLSYRTSLADYMIVSVVGLSMYSVWCVYVRFWLDSGDDRSTYQISAGVGLMVLALYLSIYAALVLILSPRYMQVRLMADPFIPRLERGDTTLIRRHTRLKRGDLIYREVHAGALTPGYIVGVPGERIDIAERVYINGVPVGRVIYPEAVNVNKTIVLKKDEYWVTPADNLDWFDTPDILAGFCTVNPSEVLGKVIAIIGPPGRRQVFETDDTSEGR
ncbi:MAG: S26 family signal peptidase [Armatimonadota bacterium]